MPNPTPVSVFLCFAAAYFLSFFYRSANAVIAPDLSTELSLNAEQLGLMTSLFFAAFAVVQIPLGILLDRNGPRWVTPALMLCGAVGSLVFASAPSFPVLALGRALIGVGMAGILMGALKAFGQWYPAQRYSTISGLMTGLGSSGAILAATPLAWLNEWMGWRGVFAWGALVVVLVAAAIVLFTRNTPPGQSWPKPPPSNVWAGLRAVFTDSRFWRVAPLIAFTNGTILSFQGLWAGPYLYDIFQIEKVAAGNTLFLLSLGVTLGFLISGWLADRFGLAQVVVAGTTVFVLVQAALAFTPPLEIVRPLMFLFGLSGGFSVLLLVQPRFLFPPELTGRAATAANVFGIGGTFTLQALMGVIIGQWARSAAGRYPPEAHAAALWFTAAGTLLTLLWYWPMMKMESRK
jgi:nitrate/nitrite transporter NarK